MTQDEAHTGSPLISDADAAYLREYLPDGTFHELLAFLKELPEDLRGLFVRMVSREAEAMGENALVIAMSRLADATNPPGGQP